MQSAPEVQEPTFDGTVAISGGRSGFSGDESDDLATLVDGGALPVQLKTVNIEDVSPTLGSDQLRAGIIAGVIGLVLVAIYMLVFYRVLGLVVIFGLDPERHDPLHARHVPRRVRQSHAQPRRRHRHHRVGGRHRRLVHRLLRTA